MENVVTRFAPSPTGSLHIGGVRTALYCYALAKKEKGKFILRYEDTDRKRFVEGSEEEILEMLTIYNIPPDEIERQSERKELYQKFTEELIEGGHAYYCFTTKEELAAARELVESNKEIFRFRSPYRDLPVEEAKKRIESGEKYVVRLKVPENKEIKFSDQIQGKMSFNTSEVDDTVLMKSDGFPTYHLAVVIDDHLMEVSHVFRAVEWIPSIPKTVLVYEAFGWEMPKFYHVPVILDPDGGKLSKRKGSVAAKDFLSKGFLPEAVINFLMLLGWSAPIERKHGESEREIFSLEEFVDLFNLKDLNKSSGIFDRKKLMWFNQQYLNDMDASELLKRYKEYLELYDTEALNQLNTLELPVQEKSVSLAQDRIRTLTDISEQLSFLFKEPTKQDFSEYKPTRKLSPQDISDILNMFLEQLVDKKEDFSDWSHEGWEEGVRGIIEALSLKPGSVFMTLRVAITLSNISPPLFESMELLGKQEVIKRLKIHL